MLLIVFIEPIGKYHFVPLLNFAAKIDQKIELAKLFGRFFTFTPYFLHQTTFHKKREPPFFEGSHNH